jgi:hypothetical protein
VTRPRVSPGRVIYADGSEAIKNQSDFRSPRRVSRGRCTRCGDRVRWRKVKGRFFLFDRGAAMGQIHHCPTTR